MQLYLIRHAQSQNNALPEEQRVEDPPITAIGHRQAEHLAEAVAKLGLTHLVTSPFRRTLETTEHLRRVTGLSPIVRKELHELGGCVRGHTAIGLTGAPGMTRIQIDKEFGGYEIAPEIDGQGWWAEQPFETYEAALQRAANLLASTRREFAGTDARVAYVMHADIKLLVLDCFHSEPLDTPYNTSITHVHVDAEAPRIVSYNRVDHLSNAMRSN